MTTTHFHPLAILSSVLLQGMPGKLPSMSWANSWANNLSVTARVEASFHSILVLNQLLETIKNEHNLMFEGRFCWWLIHPLLFLVNRSSTWHIVMMVNYILIIVTRNLSLFSCLVFRIIIMFFLSLRFAAEIYWKENYRKIPCLSYSKTQFCPLP